MQTARPPSGFVQQTQLYTGENAKAERLLQLRHLNTEPLKFCCDRLVLPPGLLQKQISPICPSVK